MDPEEAPIAPSAAAAAGQADKPKPPKSGRSHRKRNICIGILVSIVAIVLLIVILALTVFKAKDPKTTINSITVQNVSIALDTVGMRVNLNVTLDVNVGIKNPNKVSMKLKKGNADIMYRGDTVGVVPIPVAKISADKTTALNMTVTLLANRLLSNSQLYSDAKAGSMPMSTKAKVSGKVNIVGIKISVSATSTCYFTVFIGNRTVSDQDCKTKAKI